MMQLVKAYLFFLICLFLATSNAQAQQLSPPSTATPSLPQRIDPGKPIERELKAGEIHSYTIALSSGHFLDATANQQKIALLVRVLAPNGDTLTTIDSQLSDIPITFDAKTAGNYRIEIFPYDKATKPGRYEISIKEVLSAQAHAARVSDALRRQKEVIDWTKANAIPVKTVEAGNDFADLQPLKQVFSGVRFVGLGEATHGTREFFQMKHRLLEFLVREMGFRIFAMEASYAAMQAINENVMGILIDGPTALENQGYWNWNTQEVLAMMKWAREYNSSVAADKKVKFVGVDIVYNQSGRDKLLAYIKRVAPERSIAMEAFFQANIDSLSIRRGVAPAQLKENQNKLKDLKASYNELFIFLESNAADLSPKTVC
jgi:erythromycin esterase